jgi:hypothetical protein
MLGGGIHMLSHIGETIGLLVYAVSVPTKNLISAQQFPNISMQVRSKLNTFHIHIPDVYTLVSQLPDRYTHN